MRHDHIDLLKNAYAALSRRDVDGWLAAIHSDAVLDDTPITARTHRGHDQLRAWAEDTMEAAAEWQLTPEEFVMGANQSLLVRVRVTGISAGAGIPVDAVIYHVFQFDENLVASISNFFEKAEALEAVGLSQ